MKHKDSTPLNAKSIAAWLTRALGEQVVDEIARDCGFSRRRRRIQPMELLVSCLSTLGAGEAKWLADIHRTFNKVTGKSVQYKPFHNQLSKKAFPRFLRLILERALGNLTLPVLTALPRHKVTMFDDIICHDGCSFALKDSLSGVWPGRFTKVSPAAVELHVTMSALEDKPDTILLSADKESERAHGVEPAEVAGCLLLKDRGYEDRRFFGEVTENGGYFIVRGRKSIRPKIHRAYGSRGRRLRHLEGKPLSWSILPQEDVDLDIEWADDSPQPYRGRLLAIYRRGQWNRKTFTYLHTNLERAVFSLAEVGQLYRLRWQIELLFKEWKSHAGLHKFDTSKAPIAEGLIWASLLTSTLKRFVAHAAERVIGVPMSTQRVAAAGRHFLDDVLLALARNQRSLPQVLNGVFEYFRDNTRRAHPNRDQLRGRLASGLGHVATTGTI